MGKRLRIVATLCCALAFCFALVGCGGVNKAAFVGVWDLESGSDESLSPDSIKLMKSLGLEINLVLNEDGNGVLNLFGEETKATWEANSNTDGTLSINGNTAALKLSDGKLTVEDSTGTTMVFVKYDSTASTAESSSAASESSSVASTSAAEDSTSASTSAAEGSASASAASEGSASAGSEASAGEAGSDAAASQSSSSAG